MKRKVAGLGMALLLGLATSAAWAAGQMLSLGSLPVGPIEITSGKFNARILEAGKEVTFEENVKLQQGELILTCDKIVIIYRGDDGKQKTGREKNGSKLAGNLQTVSDIKSITASGNVKIVQGDTIATARKAVYDSAKRTITISEGPRVWQGPSVMIGDTIVIYLDENRVETLQGESSKIKFLIAPGTEKKDKEK
jgi:lipopolysaccharide export system protein LptA